MTNAEIAKQLEHIANLLRLQDGNPFRIRAYERAALAVGSLPRQCKDILAQDGERALQEIPGIGADLAGKIAEMLRTGRLRFLHDLEQTVPPGLLHVMEIEGMGPKRTKALWSEFGITSVAKFKALLKSGKLEGMPGWGVKSVANLSAAVAAREAFAARLPLPTAMSIAEEIVGALRASGLCAEVAIAGSLRRASETIGDIDILATSRDSRAAIELFCRLPAIRAVVAQGMTKASVRLRAGLDADLRVVAPDVFGAALYYFTGSKQHNVRVRTIGVERGITLSEYGVFRGTAARKGQRIAARTEEEVFRAIDLPWIPPELREDRGEIEAAMQGTLPALIEEADLRGDLHVHSMFSDGTATMTAMARAAQERGFTYIAITDHASPLGIVKGIKENNIDTYLRAIAAARRAVPAIRILAGAEVDILGDGRLYLSDAVLRQLDWIVASVHQQFAMSEARMTERLLRAIENPFVRAIGHPTARELSRRAPISFDVERVFRAAAENDVALEVNASPKRLDLNDVLCRRAKELGVHLVINSDAHSPAGLQYRFGVAQARRGWIERCDVLTALPWPQFQKFLRARSRER